MALRSLFWGDNQRVQRAAQNKRGMRQFEPDKEAVTLLQKALFNTGFLAPIEEIDGIYGPKTAAAVRAVGRRAGSNRTRYWRPGSNGNRGWNSNASRDAT